MITQTITNIIASNKLDPFTDGEMKIRFSLRGKQKHKQGQFYIPDGDITQKQWDQYFKFAFIRNPWDRVISEFHWRQTLRTRHPSKRLDEFLKYCGHRLKDTKNNSRDIYWAHAQTQKSFVTKDNSLILNELFRFEDLPQAVKTLSIKLDIPLKLKKYNTSKHDHYSEYYNKKTREMVANLYRDDIEMFEYEF